MHLVHNENMLGLRLLGCGGAVVGGGRFLPLALVFAGVGGGGGGQTLPGQN